MFGNPTSVRAIPDHRYKISVQLAAWTLSWVIKTRHISAAGLWAAVLVAAEQIFPHPNSVPFGVIQGTGFPCRLDEVLCLKPFEKCRFLLAVLATPLDPAKPTECITHSVSLCCQMRDSNSHADKAQASEAARGFAAPHRCTPPQSAITSERPRHLPLCTAPNRPKTGLLCRTPM